jgi:isoquinoline 1-oxidoreductase
MNAKQNAHAAEPLEDEPVERVSYRFAVGRREFLGVLGAGLLFTIRAEPALAQRRGGRSRGGAASIAARLHIGEDGAITVLTGKVEMGQGSRAELSQAAAEELRVALERVQMLMGDTGLVPDDGITAGSRTTPSTIPAVRQGAAAARRFLIEAASRQWSVAPDTVEATGGKIVHAASGRAITYAELARSEELNDAFQQSIPEDVELTPAGQWKVLGTSVPRPNRRDLVTGAHRFPSDMNRPGMLVGKTLRPPRYAARLTSVDLAPAQAMEDVVAVRDGEFVGVAAPTAQMARQALEAIAATAHWEYGEHPSSDEVYDYLRARAQGSVPGSPFMAELAAAARRLKQTYHVAYVQHAPMEPRAALAEWNDGKLTVWTGTQAPFGYHAELVRTFSLADDAVRVIVPDFGGGFGGKHTGEAAVEAARLARAAGRPVAVHWTREEEFTWAYFRPAAVIDIEASLSEAGKLTSWHFVNINSGGAAIDTPYRAGAARSRYVPSDAPLRQGSYRTLAATANNFARECFMDELAEAAGADPLDFRLAHLEEPRLRAVLAEAAAKFNWRERVKQRQPDRGVGLACGTEKNSVVAACVEIAIDRASGKIVVERVCEAFECGAVLNPRNLVAQIQSSIIMGLGPALGEEVRFRDGRNRTASFERYEVPRLGDVPELDIHILNRPEEPAVGGGETPIIAVAPAIANAVFHATGRRVRAMPIRPS